MHCAYRRRPDGQAGFADPARAGQGQQAHIGPAQAFLHRRQRLLAADQRRRRKREIVLRLGERAQRWKAGRQIRRHHLEDALRLAKVAEAMDAQALQLRVGRQELAHQIGRDAWRSGSGRRGQPPTGARRD